MAEFSLCANYAFEDLHVNYTIVKYYLISLEWTRTGSPAMVSKKGVYDKPQNVQSCQSNQ